MTGSGRDSTETSNAYQFVTTYAPNIDVLLPALAPWTVVTDDFDDLLARGW